MGSVGDHARSKQRIQTTNFRVWRFGLSHPLYVPNDLRLVRHFLSTGHFGDAIDELSRLAALGSDAAAATLGYIHFRDPDILGTTTEAVAARCAAAAARGNSYAQYVQAWRAYESGDHKAFHQWLNLSGKQLFPPALADIAGVFTRDKPLTERSRKYAKLFFERAIALGHTLSIGHYLRACKAGTFGPAYRILGWTLLPFARPLIIASVWLSPFSLKSFAYPIATKQHLFWMFEGRRIA